MNKNIYRPNPTSAIGNLSLCMSTHAFLCKQHNEKILFHKDVLNYGKDKLIKVPNIVDEDVPEDNGRGMINGWIHLKMPNIGKIMNIIIQPTDFLKPYINKNYEIVKDCIAGFHIRRGLSAEDSKKFAYHPFASQKAVDAMIKEALRLDAPVYVLSDSVSTKEYFKSKVPKAVCLDIEIGFTADEHSQKVKVDNEDLSTKINSFCEWFLLSKMPKIYMVTGGINGSNVDETVEEGIASTFGYSAALYGGKIPYYVFNDGYIQYPDGKDIQYNQKRYYWSDMPSVI